jgi:hypothetical protein
VPLQPAVVKVGPQREVHDGEKCGFHGEVAEKNFTQFVMSQARPRHTRRPFHKPRSPAMSTRFINTKNDSGNIENSQRLIAFNLHLLEQAQALAAEHCSPRRPPYAGLVGSHLRHVIEHFEALLFPNLAGNVDYDARPRDADLETNPHLARVRLQALQRVLTATAAAAGLEAPLQVHGQGGIEVEHRFQVTSSMGRELAFVASHTLHHFAMLVGHCHQHGIPTPEGFGKAAATRAHEIAQQRAMQKLTCA